MIVRYSFAFATGKVDGINMAENQEKKSGDVKPHPIIDADECKGCGLCVTACPRHVLRIRSSLNRRGVKPAEYTGEGCTGCCICFYNCPEPYAIEVEKPDKPSAKK